MSEFNGAFPWGGMKRVALTPEGEVYKYHNHEITGDNTNAFFEDDTTMTWIDYENAGYNCMVQIPKFYFCKKKIDDDWVFGVANAPSETDKISESDWRIHPAFFRCRDKLCDDQTGVAIEVDYRYAPAFLGWKDISNKLRSLPNKSPTVSITIGTARNYAKANGNGWGTLEYNLYYAIQILLLTEYGHGDSQTMIGRGYVDGNASRINTGATLQSTQLTVGTLRIKNNSTFGSSLASNILDVKNQILFEIGSETIRTMKLYIEAGATIPNTGTLSVASITYFGSSKITARTYNCQVNVKAPNNGTYSYAASSSAVFVSAGDCIFNQAFTICAEGSPNDSILTVDMNSNGNDIQFKGGFYTSDCERQFLHLIFPSFLSLFYGDIKVGHVIISTSNTDNCTWRLVGNNTISMDQYDTRIITMPHIDKFDTGTLTLNNSNPPDYLTFESITLGSIFNSWAPSVNFNNHNLYSKGSMTIAAEGTTIQNIGGSNLSAANMYFYKDAVSNGSFVGASPWSAYSIGVLQADGVSLANSIATSSTGYAIRSADLGGNVNWFFDTIPPIILETSANPGHYSQQPISAYYTITDEGGFDA
ncbi:MAG: hypothetical protein WCY24_07895, partial [Lutispora sp.]